MVYIVWVKDLVKQHNFFSKQTVLWVPRRLALFSKHSRNLKPNMTLQLPVMCSTHGIFAGYFLQASHENSTDSSFEAWFFTDLSQSSLTNKLTYIQGKWFKELQLNLAQN